VNDNRIRITWIDDDGHVVLSREQAQIQLLEYLLAREEEREPEDIRQYPADYVVIAEIAFNFRLADV